MQQRNRLILTLLVLATLLFSHTAIAGTITGTAVFEGKAPKLRPIKMDADPACAEKHSAPVYPDVLVMGDGNTLANVMVQVTGVPAKAHTPPSEAVVIDQNGCRYEPHVAGVMVGQEVLFKNSDGILHNVHGLPKVNREFNIGMPATLKEKSTSFSKPEPHFPVKCDVHPWMKTYVSVLEHPYFDVTGTDGMFKIEGVPAGTYEVVAWHEKLGTQKATVTVSDGDSAADFTFKVPTKKQ